MREISILNLLERSLLNKEMNETMSSSVKSQNGLKLERLAYYVESRGEVIPRVGEELR